MPIHIFALKYGTLYSFNSTLTRKVTSPLSSQHVDTGMGFERVAAVIQSTNGFTDFPKVTSNYDTDVFSPIFRKIEELSDQS